LQEAKTTSIAESNSRRERRQTLVSLLDIIAGIVAFLLAWQIVYWMRIWPPFLFPSPASTGAELVTPVRTGVLQSALYGTVLRMLAGFGLTLVLGFAVGVLMVYFKRFGRMMSSFCLGLQSFPSLAWAPFAILIIGLNDAAIIFVVVISSVFSVMMSTYSGLRNTPAIYIRAAKNMGTGGLGLFAGVMVPAAMPSLITGVRQAWSFAWHALIGSEMIMGAVGIGGILYAGSEFLKTNEVIASMIVLLVIGFHVDRLLFHRLEERIRNTRGLNRPS